MNRKLLRGATLALGLMVGAAPILFVGGATPAFAQNATTGALTGVVTDTTGAVVPNAKVTLTDIATGAKIKVSTNAEGRFTAALLKPDTYNVVASAQGLASTPQAVSVLVGQTPTVTLQVTPNAGSTTVTVSAQAAQLTDTQSPALITTFTEKQIQNLPAPGGDITTVAFTVPGVVVNAGGSYGNFSADGIPGTSNLYVLNGFDDEDPFLNLNNSGSSNLTLGQGEIAEASVVLNGYSSQYGRAAGAIINYTTKSGSNQFHGEANYYYNGDVLNANDWFRNNAGQGRPRAVSNEWAANIGGPILHNKLFFFADYEGLRYALPASGDAVFPTQAFQNYMLSHVPNDSVSLYKQAFNLYNASPSLASASPVTTGNGPLQDSSGTLGCGNFAGTTYNGQTFGVDTPCELAAQGTASSINKEWLFTGRVDWNISSKQKLFGRYKMDRGTQPTYTSFVNPAFNTISSQPAYEGQLNDTYSFTPNLTNQFVFAANWYTAYFGPANQQQALQTFPTYWAVSDGAINAGAANGGTLGALGTPYYFPQGRNVTQYQFVDDLTWVKGRNTFQFGYNFRRNDISDYDSQQIENGFYDFLDMRNVANGVLSYPIPGTTNTAQSLYLQNFSTKPTAYLAVYNLGAYLQDQYQPTSRLHLTLGARFDRTGNPLCNNNCFARYNGTFPQSDTTAAYNAAISDNLAHPYPNIESVIFQPRLGFNYDVTGDGHTVVRGGIGLFADLPPDLILDSLIQNFPNVYAATVQTGDVADASSPTSAGYYATQSDILLENGFANGATATQLTNELGAINVPFTPPSMVLTQNRWRAPKYLEWNLQVQHQFNRSNALIVGYAGNEGYDEIIQNPFLNAYGFGSLPSTAPDSRFGAVAKVENEANSNYNGLSVTWKHVDNHGLTADVTYTFSHALDDVSNQVGENYNSSSIYGQLSPQGIGTLNYSNADFDIRHSLVADYTYQEPEFHNHGWLFNEVAGGWLFAGKTYWRSGQPFSIIDSGLVQGSFYPLNGQAQVLAALIPGQTLPHSCTGNGIDKPCLSTSQFESASTQTTFGNIRRNSIYGPHYADSDWALSKQFVTYKDFNFKLGAYAFNVFNHPNFGLPSNDVAGGSIGSSGNILAPPTSPYGSFQQAGVGGRVLQVFGKITF
ncbi:MULTISPECIES: carboxypeptidase regulatory-like domain-containing protein [Acidobacterium]|uniref:TonB-dependent receptor plug domain protein n=1 Tax=Acidobacterium capsulatum (strain ATCC 51196 / DSM 11244 / BCRC 80197 / JCM 7670 / NBRC 15755 / NCIMB 13165 / 161) TaxID=240015 RepID=C1F385_ACIC5|nr:MULTISPECIES: carboxypeptidase regulatory-like domain-containing protein [Acidobacterium]ACO31975.1 TonB-dependent receptor plug domain protein [Acidobacterium capsulatum ATCC 51196]HCT60631.1 hypothetical protein [Acidobacterium sp.]